MKRKRTEKLIVIAKGLAGRPYKYGSKPSEAPRYFDCSSFIQYLYKQIGITLPRCAIEQARCGRLVKNKKHLKAGDLIFLHGKSGHYNKKFPMGIGHVVMYLGNGKIIHATSKRIQNYPKIIEKGEVKREPASKILKRKDIVVIKRILG
ncbi:MAG: hypothetical protein COY22_01665 [Candidatus Tagabacteria bacterium CG_4_10_14_0_2_um_filter_40_13]|uniref:NlpC/P60 domain-containing protein n=1 Tax=Candidatus Tagabacteria bacterium CG_4_9_14_0_2_um_filter_41_11 TaxID=1975019 RepID=A0A2M8ERK4_9BACT|nr:MAG: hypothetical protein COY22_01665 [Candidatus Tagabacteria bacterium CG_4_10_14_0_2_um_filter_40_13]PJC25311.1 MAG: hypothetical protein CO056_01060 [Candidatus Tagabacteria bacterium CG_4_9_14_0_2_um_filter_41_11]